MTVPINAVADQTARANKKKEDDRKFNEQSTIDALDKEVKAEKILADILKLLAKVNLDTPEAKQAVQDIQKKYSTDEATLFFSTLFLFAKKHVLTPESFNFLKISMNIIEYVFNFVSSLFNNDLLDSFNLDKFFNLPILKNINALFNVLSKDDEGELNQSTYDDVISNSTPISEKFVELVNEAPLLKEVSSALLAVAKKGIDSEVVMKAVKAHSAPEAIAKAIIELKNQGVELTQSMLDKLIDSKELNDPKAMVDVAVDYAAKELKKSLDDSVMAYAEKEVSNAAIASVGSATSSIPSKVWQAGVEGVSSIFSFFQPVKVEPALPKAQEIKNNIPMTAQNDEEEARHFEI